MLTMEPRMVTVFQAIVQSLLTTSLFGVRSDIHS
jgi:hypothetical protein